MSYILAVCCRLFRQLSEALHLLSLEQTILEESLARHVIGPMNYDNSHHHVRSRHL